MNVSGSLPRGTFVRVTQSHISAAPDSLSLSRHSSLTSLHRPSSRTHCPFSPPHVFLSSPIPLLHQSNSLDPYPISLLLQHRKITPMASYEATEVTSAPTRGPLDDILREGNIFLNPSQWGAEQIHSLRIQLVDAEQSNKPVPGDPTLAVEIDTDALAKLFKQRDEHDPGCYSINQAISTAIEALEHRNIAQNHRRHYFRLGNRRCVISPSSYFMINEISAVAVENPANVYVRRQHRKTPDETISYFSGAVEGEVHPVNIAQLIILAQHQEMAMKQGSISNTYPLTVCTEPSTIIRVPANNCR